MNHLSQEGVEEISDRDIRLMNLAENLLKKRDEAITFRAASGIEKEWDLATQLYEGEDAESRASMLEYATGEATRRSINEQPRSRVVVNVTRCRTDTAVGRFVDIITPTDRANYELDITPVPELSDMLTDRRKAVQPAPDGSMQPVTFDDGQPATISDVAQDIREKAKKKMEAMAAVIADQTAECDFIHEERKAIADAARLGTGILKGPIAGKDTKKSWQQTENGFILEIVEDISPRSKRVNPRNVYPAPDCGDDIRKASYIWERDEILPREVRNLIGLPGYFDDQLRLVLEEEPRRTKAMQDSKSKWEIARDSINRGSAYEIWEGYLEVSREDLEALGCECQTDYPTVSACVVFINDRPVRVDLNILDTGAFPYDFFPWLTVEGRPWGRGIPYEMHHLQLIIKAAWRAMMDNSRDSAGPIVLVGSDVEQVGSADGSIRITGKTILRATSKDTDVRTQLNQFQLTNNQAELQAVIELALRFIDLVTGIPTIFQGEQQELPETLGQTNIVVDSANIGLRMRVKIFDDMVTRPHIRRYYDYNMQYHPDDEIKGDYKVVPIGLSALYERDQQAQTLIQVFQLKADPDVNRITDWEKATKQFFQMKRLDVLKSPEKIAEEEEKQKGQQGPVNPQAEVANIRVQGEMQKAQMNQQSDMTELQLKVQEADRDRQFKKEMAAIERENLILKLASAQNISLESIKAALAGKTMELSTQKELAYNVPKTPQVAHPAMEPPGRAENGRAFQE